MDNFINEQLGENGSFDFFKPFKKLNLKTFKHIMKVIEVSVKDRIIPLKVHRDLFGQIALIMQHRSMMKQDNTLTVTKLADPEDEDCSADYKGLFINIREVYDRSITRCMFQFLKRNWNMLLVHWF